MNSENKSSFSSEYFCFWEIFYDYDDIQKNLRQWSQIYICFKTLKKYKQILTIETLIYFFYVRFFFVSVEKFVNPAWVTVKAGGWSVCQPIHLSPPLLSIYLSDSIHLSLALAGELSICRILSIYRLLASFLPASLPHNHILFCILPFRIFKLMVTQLCQEKEKLE